MSCFQRMCYIELLNNKLHGLSPPGGFVSPSVGFASLLFDQAVPKSSQRHLADRKTICILHWSDCAWLCCLLSQLGLAIASPGPLLFCNYFILKFNWLYWKWHLSIPKGPTFFVIGLVVSKVFYHSRNQWNLVKTTRCTELWGAE